MNENNENKLYQELGKFIINYESIVNNIKRGIIFLMQNFNNSSNNNYQICLQILISEIESEKLIHKYGALLFLFIQKDNTYFSKIDELFKTLLELNTLRNNLIHRYYMIGYEINTSKLSINSMNQKAKKSGLRHNFLNLTYQDLEKINNEVGKIDKLLGSLWEIITGECMIYFAHFKIEEIKEMRKIFKK